MKIKRLSNPPKSQELLWWGGCGGALLLVITCETVAGFLSPPGLQGMIINGGPMGPLFKDLFHTVEGFVLGAVAAFLWAACKHKQRGPLQIASLAGLIGGLSILWFQCSLVEFRLNLFSSSTQPSREQNLLQFIFESMVDAPAFLMCTSVLISSVVCLAWTYTFWDYKINE